MPERFFSRDSNTGLPVKRRNRVAFWNGSNGKDRSVDCPGITTPGQDASPEQQAEAFTKWVECVAKKVENGEFGVGGDLGGSFTSHANYPKIGCSACVATVKNTHDVVTDCYCPNYRESGCAKLAGDRSKKQKECRAEEGGYVFSDMG